MCVCVREGGKGVCVYVYKGERVPGYLCVCVCVSVCEEESVSMCERGQGASVCVWRGGGQQQSMLGVPATSRGP